jgi:hypothetical protein
MFQDWIEQHYVNISRINARVALTEQWYGESELIKKLEIKKKKNLFW